MDNQLLQEILKWVVLLLLLMLLSKLLNKASSKWQEEKGEALEGSGTAFTPNSGSEACEESEDSPFETESRSERRERLGNKLKEILEQNPDLADAISQQAGIESSDVTQWSQEKLQDVADRLGEEILQLLGVSNKKLPIDLNIKSGKPRLVPVRFGGVTSRKRRARGPDDIERLVPEELGRPLPDLIGRLERREAQVTERLEIVRTQKLLYVLRDRSGSMLEDMAGGLTKDVWARGVVLKFALEALKGQVTFFFRDFDTQSKTIQKVLNRGDVPRFMEYLFNHPAPGNAGTDIFNAIKRAIKDINGETDIKVGKADIVLISDGADNSLPSPEKLKELLGDIKLHVIMIRDSNDILKATATTYITL